MLIRWGTAWYHYKDPYNAPYRFNLLISVDEVSIIAQIEKYGGYSVEDTRLKMAIIEKDRQYRSMGLIWNLLWRIEKQLGFDKEGPDILWTLNNIRDVAIEDNNLILSGDAGDNRFGEESFIVL